MSTLSGTIFSYFECKMMLKKKRERERKKTEKERGMRPGRKVIKGGQKK